MSKRKKKRGTTKAQTPQRQQLQRRGNALPRIFAAGRVGHYPEYANLSLYRSQALMYQQSPWVYLAVKKIATSASSVKLSVMRRSGERLDPQIDHPIERLLRRPNDYTSRTELIESLITNYLLTGNAYLFLAGPPGGQPNEMMTLRPDRVRVVAGRDTNALVSGYVYEVNGMQVPLAAEEVIHWKDYHPLDDWYGLSRLEAAAIDLQSDYEMAKWNRNYFGKDKAIPAGIVKLQPTVSDEDYDRIVEEWRTNYGGNERRTAFLRSGEMEYADIGFNQKDMEFLAGRQFLKETILQIYGIPPGMLDKNATEANAIAGQNFFNDNTLWPIMDGLASKFTSDLCPFWGADLEVEAEDIRSKDAAGERADIQTAAPYLSINEVRSKWYDTEPVEWGDQPAQGAAAAIGAPQPFTIAGGFGAPPVPTAVQAHPAGTPGALPEPKPTELPAVPSLDLDITPAGKAEMAQFARFIAKRTDPTIKAQGIEAFRFNALSTRTVIAVKAFADVADADEIGLLDLAFKAAITPSAARVDLDGEADPQAREKTTTAQRMYAILQDYLSDLQRSVVASVRYVNNYTKTPLLRDLQRFLSYLDGEFYQRDLQKLAAQITPLLFDAIEQAGGDTAQMLYLSSGVRFDPSSFGTAAADFARQWTDTVLAGFGTTTQSGIGALLQRWIDTGGSKLEDLIGAIQESHLFSPKRAALIAETEATRAYAHGSLAGATEMARAADVPIRVNGEQMAQAGPPLHPRCRCWTVSQFIYDAGENIIGMDFVWKTNVDDRICQRCRPRHNHYVSEYV